MVATRLLADRESVLKTLRTLLHSVSVFSKQPILDNGLVAAIVDDHFLYNEEGLALVNAFKHLGAKTINWSNTSDLIIPSKSIDIHVVDCTYEGLVAGYLEFDDSIKYWNHVLFLDNLNAIVLHTAFDHIIYVGSEAFVNEATQRKNQFHDNWLSVIGQAFSDPELITEYGLREILNGGN